MDLEEDIEDVRFQRMDEENLIFMAPSAPLIDNIDILVPQLQNCSIELEEGDIEVVGTLEGSISITTKKGSIQTKSIMFVIYLFFL